MSTGKNTRFTREWKIGLVSVAIIALFVWVCFFLAGRNIFSKENTFYAVFDNAGGINISGPVLVNGKKVGRISEIEFVSETDHRIRVGLSILKKYKINKGSVASLESLGLMSGSGIVICLGDSPEFMEAGELLAGQQVPGLMAQLAPMEATIGCILGSLDSIMRNINAVLDKKAVGELGGSISALHASLKSVESITAHADALVSANESRIHSLIASVESLGRMFGEKQDEIAAAISNFSAVSDTLAQADIAGVLRSFRSALRQTETILARVNAGDGSVGQLLANDTLYRNLEKSSRQLSLLLEDLRVNPERYVHISVFGRKEKKAAKPTLE